MTVLNYISKINQKNWCLESSYLGAYDYVRAEQLQRDLHQMALLHRQYAVIGLEHPAVLTLGQRAIAGAEIISMDIPVVRSSRGGLATIHSEGQLVIYPILNLRELKLGVKDYVYLLLKITRELLAGLGVTSSIDEKAVGLYTATGKIAFCGIQVKNGVSQHGISLNVRNDLNLFSAIRACGIQNSALDKLAHHGVDATLSELFEKWNSLFVAELERLTAKNEIESASGADQLVN